jgi:hypothetical protein
MEMKRKKLQQDLKQELELLSSQPLTDSQVFEAYFNVSGFLKVLNKMKKETIAYGKI